MDTISFLLMVIQPWHPWGVLAPRPQEPGGLFGPGPGPPPMEYYDHAPWFTYPERISNGTEMPGIGDTPDFRIEEDAWLAYSQTFFKEQLRPYRMSPNFMQTDRFNRYNVDGWGVQVLHAENFGCYCTTVYKRLTVLAGCAVLTTRHILTTATATELVLSKHRDAYELESILGAWYDHDANTYNSSVYMAPSRIHYHPQYLHPHQVNVTHPAPFSYDLSVWAATRNFFRTLLTIGNDVVVCARGGPHWWEHAPSTPRKYEVAFICGFQYIKAARKKPLPWFKYCTQSKENVVPCPKVEWGWFHCISGNVWGKFGVESGAAWHRCLKNGRWVYDGLIGMNAFSLDLRSQELTHYFTVLNSHPNLDFMYNAYMNYIPCEWYDQRFYNSRGRAPWYKRAYKWGLMHFYPGLHDYNEYGYPHYKGAWLPWYKK